MDSTRMIHCPKCGFEQPEDQYCAKCGVDMSKVEIKKTPAYLNPIVIGTAALVLVVIGVQAVRFARMENPGLAEDRRPSRARLLMAEASRSIKSRVDQAKSEDQKPSLADNRLLSNDSENSDSSSTTRQGQANSPQAAPGANAQPASAASNSPSIGTTVNHESKLAETAASSAAPNAKAHVEKQNHVTFAWAEAAAEWLAMLGALEAGVHPIADLENRLREARGAYRVFTVSKKSFSELTAPVVLRKSTGDAALVFTAHGAGPAPLIGTLDLQFRRTIASQPPFSDQIEIVPGHGYIVKVNLPASQPGYETVVVVLPASP